MLSYCGNNPINFLDPNGQYLTGMDLANFAGGHVGSPSSTSNSGTKSSCQTLSRKGTLKNRNTPAFSPGRRPAKELAQIVTREIRSAAKEINSLPDKYPTLKIHEGGNDIYSGINNIKKGGTLLLSPLPTCIEDVVGVGLCAYGVMQATGGLVKIVVGIDSLC